VTKLKSRIRVKQMNARPFLRLPTMKFGSHAILASVVLVLSSVSALHSAALAQGQFTIIDVPASINTMATAINDKGTVTGYFLHQRSDGTILQTGFIRTPDGHFKRINRDNFHRTISPVDINDDGTVTGGSDGRKSKHLESFVAEHGYVKQFRAPDSLITDAEGINKSGEIVGTIYLDGGAGGSFIRTPDGTVTTFTDGMAGDVNDAGEIVGQTYSDDSYGAFVRSSGGVVTTFSVGLYNTEPGRINNLGVVAGSYTDDSEWYYWHGFVRDADGGIEKFDVPGNNRWTQPIVVDELGNIAGDYMDSNEIFHGFIRNQDDTFTLFDPPGSVWTVVSGMKQGVVVGSFEDSNSKYHGFLYAP
jgi:hypothetical protein